MATGLEHSRNGVSIADGAEVLLAGGLQGAERRVSRAGRPDKETSLRSVHSWASVYVGGAQPDAAAPTHQGGSSCLGRGSGQVCQHLFHLGQLLRADVICVCGR